MSQTTPRQYQSVDPSTGTVLATYGTTTPEAIESVLAAGHKAYVDWCARTLEERARVVGRIARELEARADQLAETAVREMGKPMAEARRGDRVLRRDLRLLRRATGPGWRRPAHRGRPTATGPWCSAGRSDCCSG